MVHAMDKESSKSLESPPRWLSERYKMAYMGFLGYVLIFAMRIVISIALVDMTGTSQHVTGTSQHVTGTSQHVTGTSQHVTTDSNQECPILHMHDNTSINKTSGQFDWTAREQAYILSSFYCGYIVGQMPGGYLASRVGGKYVFGISVLVSGILTLLNPLAAHLGAHWLIFVRVLIGLAQSSVFPAFFSMMGLWVPDNEKSSFSTITGSGGFFGLVLAPSIIGYLCSVELLDGWPLGFYIIGSLSVVWFLVWCRVVHSSPLQHPRIPQSELDLLLQTVPRPVQPPPIPWRKILTNVHIWAMNIAHIGVNFTSFGLMSVLPIYLGNVLNFDISANGFVNSLPWLFAAISAQVVSVVTDYIRSRGFLTTTTIRKINQLMGTVLPGTFLVLAGYAGCNPSLAIFFILVGMIFFGFNWSAYDCNVLDLAPLHAGVVYSISNTLAAIPGIVAPNMVELIIKSDPHSKDLWRLVFYMFAAISISGGVFYLFFGSGEPLSWGVLKTEEPDDSRTPLLDPAELIPGNTQLGRTTSFLDLSNENVK